MFITAIMFIALFLFFISIPTIVIEITKSDLKKPIVVLFWIIRSPAVLTLNALFVFALILSLSPPDPRPESIITLILTVIVLVIEIGIYYLNRSNRVLKILMINLILIINPIVLFIFLWILGNLLGS